MPHCILTCRVQRFRAFFHETHQSTLGESKVFARLGRPFPGLEVHSDGTCEAGGYGAWSCRLLYDGARGQVGIVLDICGRGHVGTVLDRRQVTVTESVGGTLERHIDIIIKLFLCNPTCGNKCIGAVME